MKTVEMRNYGFGFADGRGDITRGLQLWPSDAAKKAQQFADEYAAAVDYWDEDGENSSPTTVEPAVEV